MAAAPKPKSSPKVFKPYNLSITVSSKDDSEFLLSLLEKGIETAKATYGGFPGVYQAKVTKFLKDLQESVVAQS